MKCVGNIAVVGWTPPILTWYQVNRMKDRLDDFNFGVVVCDECHYLKNQRAARTKVRCAPFESLEAFSPAHAQGQVD